jgi:two-component sensor histidine kinase
VTVAVQRRDEKTVELLVQDDGVGIPATADVRAMTSMGMTLVLGLVNQLGGKVTVERNNGTTFTITFPA